jgi:hypothetical protein
MYARSDLLLLYRASSAEPTWGGRRGLLVNERSILGYESEVHFLFDDQGMVRNLTLVPDTLNKGEPKAFDLNERCVRVE